MNKEQIKEFLPHREPMLLVDEIEINENNIGYAKYRVTGEEFFLKGHFPGHPVVPGVILCEIMAQSSGLLLGNEIKGKQTLYTGIDNVRFKTPVYPGDTVEVTTEIVARKAKLIFVKAKAEVNGKLCVKGDLSFALI